jgi:signal transduction histidine kinase
MLAKLIRQIVDLFKQRFGSIPLVDRQWSKELETDRERRGLFLRILNRGWLLLALMAVISWFYYPDERKSLSFFIFFALSTFILVRILNQAHQIVLAGFLFTSLVNTSFFAIFLLNGFTIGFRDALVENQYILMMMALGIIFAGALIHRWAALSLAALNSTMLLFITQSIAPEAGPLLSVHIFWWLVAISIWLYETSLSIALAKLKAARADLENQVELRTHSLKETVTTLERTQASLQTKKNELEAFSYSVSHDLRAPLRAIDGYAEILNDDYASKFDPEGHHILERMRENVRKMDQMIQGLLFLSRLDRHSMQWQIVNPARLAEEIFTELHKQNPDQPVQFVAQNMPSCQADASLLRQAILNLLSNALKFSRMRSPAEITFFSQASPEGTIYSLKDNGVGFDMQQVHRLFAPFQRLHRQEEFEGNGIGLSLVQRIIQRHNGRIWAEAAVDRGATFSFILGVPAEGDEIISNGGRYG